MEIVFDPKKNDRNIARRGLSFELVGELEWDRALVVEDVRRDYGEVRLQVTAPMKGRIFIAIVTPRGDDLRVISFRKANAKEIENYGKAKT